MTEAPKQPQRGEVWQHHNGNHYTVLYVTNEHGEPHRREEYPRTVVYEGENGHVWSRPLAQWHRSFTYTGIRRMMHEPRAESPVIDANVEAVREAFRLRANHGLTKYGTTTERTDLSLRDWLQHAQEEAMDFCVYLEAAKARVAELVKPKPIWGQVLDHYAAYPDFLDWLNTPIVNNPDKLVTTRITDGGYTLFECITDIESAHRGWMAGRDHASAPPASTPPGRGDINDDTVVSTARVLPEVGSRWLRTSNRKPWRVTAIREGDRVPFEIAVISEDPVGVERWVPLSSFYDLFEPVQATSSWPPIDSRWWSAEHKVWRVVAVDPNACKVLIEDGDYTACDLTLDAFLKKFNLPHGWQFPDHGYDSNREHLDHVFPFEPHIPRS